MSEVKFKACVLRASAIVVQEQDFDRVTTERPAPDNALKAFANDMIAAAFEGGSFDGGDIQDIAVKHGLLRIERREEECGDVCACRSEGDGFPAECYRKTALLYGEQPAPVVRCSFCDATDQAGNPWTGHHESVDGEVVYRVMGCKDHKHLVDALQGVESAPVAMVLPERKHIPDFTQHPLLNKEYMGWNAFLDEVTRINGINQ